MAMSFVRLALVALLGALVVVTGAHGKPTQGESCYGGRGVCRLRDHCPGGLSAGAWWSGHCEGKYYCCKPSDTSGSGKGVRVGTSSRSRKGSVATKFPYANAWSPYHIQGTGNPMNLKKYISWKNKVAKYKRDTSNWSKSDNLLIQKWYSELQTLKTKNRDYQLNRVQSWVDSSVNYKSDTSAFGTPDYWATPQELFRGRWQNGGDCEDHALFKRLTLVELGWDPNNLLMVYVRDLKLKLAHMILVVYHKGKFHALDNQFRWVYEPSTHKIVKKRYAPVYAFTDQAIMTFKKASGGRTVNLAVDSTITSTATDPLQLYNDLLASPTELDHAVEQPGDDNSLEALAQEDQEAASDEYAEEEAQESRNAAETVSGSTDSAADEDSEADTVTAEQLATRENHAVSEVDSGNNLPRPSANVAERAAEGALKKRITAADSEHASSLIASASKSEDWQVIINLAMAAVDVDTFNAEQPIAGAALANLDAALVRLGAALRSAHPHLSNEAVEDISESGKDYVVNVFLNARMLQALDDSGADEAAESYKPQNNDRGNDVASATYPYYNPYYHYGAYYHPYAYPYAYHHHVAAAAAAAAAAAGWAYPHPYAPAAAAAAAAWPVHPAAYWPYHPAAYAGAQPYGIKPLN
eukprot:TRINITY_DN77_c0_g1_i7.p1 TRINITY_DN77_c0_g1~~TRINITY_DN77_c0_g1_i7.p1  ORF type:complete len:639 (-),score=161.68 TRINITY_DN77_c0_g1_i7:188-2104(-)